MKNLKSQIGFTLIELLVVMAIIGIVVGVGLASLASTLRSTAKTNVFNQVKQNGDLALEILTRSVQSAQGVCTRDGSDSDTDADDVLLIFTSRVENCPASINEAIRFECKEGTGIITDPSDVRNGLIEKSDIDVITGSVISGGHLTSGVRINVTPQCTFIVSETFPKRVTIDITLSQDPIRGTGSDVAVDIPFHTEVTMRNF